VLSQNTKSYYAITTTLVSFL